MLSTTKSGELVVNWHLTEACNYKCNYCYAAWSKPNEEKAVWRSKEATSELLNQLYNFFSPENQSNDLKSELEWTNVRLSIAGGEPLLAGKRFKSIVNDASSLGFKLSLITNGSMLTEDMLEWLCPQLDMLGISVDADSIKLNRLIGRSDRFGNSMTTSKLKLLINLAKEINPKLLIKINTVVNQSNWNSDLSSVIASCKPDRWKVLRALPSISNDIQISDEQFIHFVNKHMDFRDCMSVEDNTDMEQSYIMVDPHGRFFQNDLSKSYQNGYVYSDQILQVGAEEAFSQIGFNSARFAKRYTSGAEVISA